MEMGVSKGTYKKRERAREGHVSALSCAVLSPPTLTRHRCMLLSLNSQLLLDAISVHLKFSSQPFLFPSAHTAVSL